MTPTSTRPQPIPKLPTVPAVNPQPIPDLDPSLVRLEAEAITMRDYYQSGGRY